MSYLNIYGIIFVDKNMQKILLSNVKKEKNYIIRGEKGEVTEISEIWNWEKKWNYAFSGYLELILKRRFTFSLCTQQLKNMKAKVASRKVVSF